MSTKVELRIAIALEKLVLCMSTFMRNVPQSSIDCQIELLQRSPKAHNKMIVDLMSEVDPND